VKSGRQQREVSGTGTYHGWHIAWALAVTQTVGYGVLFYAFSVFMRPMEAELGWSRAQTSGAYSLALLLSGLAAVPIGRWVDAHGARLLMTAGSLAGALLILAWSFVASLPALYLVQAGIGLVMAAVLYEVAFTVITTWFRRDRIRAMLIVTLVAGLASTIFIPLATLLVEEFGWRAALRLLALILAACTVPLHALVLRHHPRQLGLEVDGLPGAAAGRTPAEHSVEARDALRSGVFWWLSAAFALDRITVVAIAAHVVPLLLERGYSPGLVAAAAGSIGLMQLAGRLLFAPATSRLSLVMLTVITFAVRAVALVALLLVPGLAGLWSFAALFGLANGASTLARAGLVADVFGPAHYGSINGSIAMLVALAQTAAPLAVGALHDYTGSYSLALRLLLAAALLAAGAVAQAGRTVREAGSSLPGAG
jgi:MFS family permease